MLGLFTPASAESKVLYEATPPISHPESLIPSNVATDILA